MASSILGIDLDAAEIRLAELSPGGGGFTLLAALTLPVGAADPATLGAQLKERLKQVGFKANSAVIALGHDAFTARVVRHPDIPEGELPAIVQFQVLKEVSLPADDTIVDYVPLKQPLATGERRSLTFVVRKGRVHFCEKLCEAAGLKLLAVVPRAVALTAALTKGRTEATGTAGFAASQSFFVLSNGELVYNRGLSAPHDAADFFGEVRRSVAGYESQPSMPALGALFIANNTMPENSDEFLTQSRVPAQVYDTYAGVQGTDRLAKHGDYAVAIGAAQVTKAFRKPPVDFLAPKKVVVKPNNTRKYVTYAAFAAGVLALLVGGGYWVFASSFDAEIAALQTDNNQRKETEKTTFADVDKKFEALDAWNKQEMFILEELYDLVAAFPDIAGVQIVRAEWKTTTAGLGQPPAKLATPAKTAAPSGRSAAKPVARLTVKATAEQDSQFEALQAALRNGLHWTYVGFDIAQERNTRTYVLDIHPMKPADYAEVIAPGKHVTATGDGQSTNPRRPGFRRTGGRP